ncbi:MAG: alpha/beta hydrolase, partial [Thermoanaerobaculia bacterium]|nr:alpha/beta hydrolase [Thermoanaerobaculia bacterium]
MTESHPFRLETSHGRTLCGIVDLPETPGPRPSVIICHGFKGFQEWAFLPSLAELLAQRGFTAIRFNFSGAGMHPGDELVTDLEAFRQATVGRDLEDLEA